MTLKRDKVIRRADFKVKVGELLRKKRAESNKSTYSVFAFCGAAPNTVLAVERGETAYSIDSFLSCLEAVYGKEIYSKFLEFLKEQNAEIL